MLSWKLGRKLRASSRAALLVMVAGVFKGSSGAGPAEPRGLTSVDGRWRLLPCSELVLSMLIWSTSFRPFQSTAITSFPELARGMLLHLQPPYAHPTHPSLALGILRPDTGAALQSFPSLQLPLLLQTAL